MRHFLCNALLLLASAAAETSSDTCSIAVEQHAKDVVDWLRSEGGFFNDKLEVRRADPSDPTSYLGVFATDTIQPKEALLTVPASSMIRAVEDEQPISDEEYTDALCDLTHVVLKELRSGEQSHFAPYVKYLLDQEEGQLPASWTEAAKELMREIVDADTDRIKLVDWIEMEFENTECIRKGDAFEQHALALVVQRGWDSVMIPIYDMINHVNDPNKKNTDNTSVYGPKGLRTWATKLIEAGEEIFASYDQCFDCHSIPAHWGTTEILRDFGFVEPYPRKFRIGETQILFQIKEVREESGDTFLEIEWLDDDEDPDSEDIGWMKEEYHRLQDLQHDGTLEEKRHLMPEKEWNVIFQYHQALTTAIGVAIEVAIQDLHAADDENDCDKDGTCDVPLIRYGDLNKEIESSDEYYFWTYQCETLVFGIEHFLGVGSSESHYQNMDYYRDPETKEMCFHIDGVFQQCTSYRPQYHEMAVHLPARYLPDGLKRVLWIGGGDAMLLHEILKYSELELAVGLELDQKVTRGAFKYFGVQPHWDNEKVQWWYGDASKSLLMLPEDYFGSFDMVLVDLSDTVLSLSVTKEMDIIGALSLLLKPEGIFAMNELFFKRVSEVFENTVQVQFENVPKICDQAFVLASNRIDFLSRNLTGHDTENNLYIEPFDAESDPFDLVHDYRRNHDSGYKKLCKNDHEDDGGVLEQEGSPGIFMAVEAEEVTMELQSMKDVQAAVTKALEQEGLKVDSVAESQAGSAPAETVLVLREGYVAIRTWPEQKYCAFDIHLWSSFEKHEAAKKAVVASVGGMIENASSYRIVAGGMFGVSTWKDDAKVHGPQMDKLCDRSDAPGRDAPIDSNTVEVAIEAGVRLIRDEHPIIAAVVCGKSEECPTVALLEKNDKVEKVIVLSRCSYLMPDDEDLGQGLERIIACEREILQILNDSLTDGKLLGVVVVDGGATHLMGQIVLKILTDSTISHTRTLFSPELIAIATIDDEETESWKRNFLDEVRRDVVRLDPVFRIEILLNTTDSSMELGITASGDDHFIQHLTDTFASVQNESGLSVEIRRFHGGLWRTSTKVLMDDSEADHLYSHESYNRTAPMEQWRSQTPLAHQSLLQFETRPLRVGDNVVVTFADEDDDEDDEMFQGIVEWVNDDNTYFVKFDEGDVFDAVERIDIRKLYGSPNDQMLTATQVKNALKNALSSMPYRMMAEQADVEELASAGDGSVLSAFWSGGSMLLMWDGRTHFDINLITYFESSRLGEDLVIKLKEEISGLETILLDEHPRGSGRVVNFKKDLESMDPYWA